MAERKISLRVNGGVMALRFHGSVNIPSPRARALRAEKIHGKVDK